MSPNDGAPDRGTTRGGRARDQARDKVADLVGLGGLWSAALDPLIETHPDFVEAYVDLASHPWRAGRLAPKTRHLVGLSLSAAATHLYRPGIRSHCRAAIDAGATADEILETLMLASTLGVHACVLGVPILTEKLAAKGDTAASPTRDDARRGALKAEFVKRRGYWNPVWDGLLALDPDYFAAFTAFSSMPWRSGALEPKVKEFIYIATDVSATHQFAPGTHIHVENALGLGASAEEILEVMQLASTLGIETFEVALPIVLEELGARA
ncbi:carboxymuconolactone decarboxylase family protein [Lichenibacterium dinghuense]|uniref:carboxymuconolactone decarboxylase family protein n=1 Tax=Lichenibacterium dinghuense TaxID=2895977 RepID=UPI001F38434F|nr:carboxymuconolactone decarboxylase family protein [Lichenibacterium sp. 6Y81]